MNAATTYDPEIRASRALLAKHLIDQLEAWGFGPIDAGARELVYARETGPGLECRVYTTVEHGMARAKDTDAIRVALVYTAGDRPRPCGKARRVYRTGVVSEIAGRVKDRIDKISEGVEFCRCGAPKFKSRNKNLVCAALCWKSPSEPARSKSTQVVRANPRSGGLLIDVRAPRAGVQTYDGPPPSGEIRKPDAVYDRRAVEQLKGQPMGRRRPDGPRGREW